MKHGFNEFRASNGIMLEHRYYGLDTDLFFIYNLIFKWM